jgi:hypothetical protein
VAGPLPSAFHLSRRILSRALSLYGAGTRKRKNVSHRHRQSRGTPLGSKSEPRLVWTVRFKIGPSQGKRGRDCGRTGPLHAFYSDRPGSSLRSSCRSIPGEPSHILLRGRRLLAFANRPANWKQFSSPGAAAPTAAAFAAAGSTTLLASATGSNSTASSLSQLQALNNALASLGLNAQQLAQVDRIASLIQDFNPTAFLSLVHQLGVLAQANSNQPAAANVANSAVPGRGQSHADEQCRADLAGTGTTASRQCP